MTTVLVKNMSLPFLKDQGGDFFSSDIFNNAVDLFNKYKAPVTDEIPESKDKLVLPLQMLRNLLETKYFEDVIEGELNNSQKTDLLFIALSGKYSNAPTYKLRKYITASTSNIKPCSDFLVSTIGNHIFKNIAKKNKRASKEKGRDFISELLKSEDTINPIADIVNKSKFYANNQSVAIYDDVAYYYDTVARLLNNQVGFVSNTVPVSAVRTHLTGSLPIANKDMILICEALRAKLFNNYFERASFSLGGYNFDNPNIETTDDSFNPNIMKAALSLRNGNYPLIIIRTHILNDSEFLIEHNRNVEAYKIELFDVNGVMKTDTITEIIPYDSNNLKVTVSEQFTGEALLLLDRNDPNRVVQQNLFHYFRDLGGDRMERYRYNPSFGNTIELLLNGYTDGYFFHSIRTVTDTTPIIAESVVVTPTSIIIQLPINITQSVEVVLLPTYRVLGSISHTKVTSENVNTYLSTINPFNEDVRAWSI